MMLLLKYWRLLSIGLSVVAILGFAAWLYHKGGSDREDQIISDAVIEKIEKKEKLDAIRNSPVGVDDVVKRLRKHTF